MIAGPTGSPDARSHKTVVARWSAIPTPSTLPASASVARATARTDDATLAASTSTKEGAGVEASTASE